MQVEADLRRRGASSPVDALRPVTVAGSRYLAPQPFALLDEAALVHEALQAVLQDPNR